MKERRYDLDWVRVVATLAVFVFHSGRFFDTFDWHLKNAQQSDFLLMFVAFLDLWMMPLLFLLSGLGSWHSLTHRIMGVMQRLYGDFEAAEYHIRRAMELNPSDAYIKARSAAFYTYKGEPTRALELIEAAVVQDPFLPVWCIEDGA